MTTFDKVAHALGAAATGILAAGLSGGVAVPAWLMLTAVGVQFATGAATSPMVRRKDNKPDARGQVRDDEDPK